MKYTDKPLRPILLFLLLFYLCLSCSEDAPSAEATPETEAQQEEAVPGETDDTEGDEGENEGGEQNDDAGEDDANGEDGEDEGDNGDDTDEDDESTDDDDGANDHYGTIELSGDETSEIGESLTVGHIGIGLSQLTGNERTIVLTDSNTPISEEEGPQPNDLENNFVIVALDLGDQATEVADRALSINISVDGTDYKYACASPVVGTFIACGDGFYIDFDKKQMVFDDAQIANTTTKKVLTLKGTITWE
ncbi:hypothetical protein [Pseudozobellia thermophila]|uniref:Uncharacterized protein n=1 Tax=Pseudozobellia thermophila TaxID=192903 RepID=A0A1M6MLV1_9FLAO|nr:hypothetical protein [Pseudozobellia thermophila]SHJ84447.1 hypothetical protein SAMN04488513_11050 [Pseudozobellia thermophila]